MEHIILQNFFSSRCYIVTYLLLDYYYYYYVLSLDWVFLYCVESIVLCCIVLRRRSHTRSNTTKPLVRTGRDKILFFISLLFVFFVLVAILLDHHLYI